MTGNGCGEGRGSSAEIGWYDTKHRRRVDGREAGKGMGSRCGRILFLLVVMMMMMIKIRVRRGQRRRNVKWCMLFEMMANRDGESGGRGAT